MVTYIRVRIKETGDHVDVPEERLAAPDAEELFEVLEGYPPSNYDRRPAFKVDLKNGREPEVEIGGTVDVDLGSGDAEDNPSAAGTPTEGTKKKG